MLGQLSLPLSLVGGPQVACVPLPQASSHPHRRAPSPGARNIHLCLQSQTTVPSLDFSLYPDCTFVKHPFIKFFLNYPACNMLLSPVGTLTGTENTESFRQRRGGTVSEAGP